MDFDSLIACQSGLGTGAVIVMNKQVCFLISLLPMIFITWVSGNSVFTYIHTIFTPGDNIAVK